MTDKVFVLLSGGIDSSVAAFAAHERHDTAGMECVSIDYGQRHSKEIESAKKIAAHLGAEHHTINLQGLLSGMLTNTEEAIPNASYDDLPHGISPTYVAFRNGTMLSVLAARAQAWCKQNPGHKAYMYCGVHAEDAANWAYPDCTPEFIGAMANAIFIGTYQDVRLNAPLQHLMKSDIVSWGYALEVPFMDTWSCYKGGEHHCGVCPTCRSRKQAFIDAGVADPTIYEA